MTTRPPLLLWEAWSSSSARLQTRPLSLNSGHHRPAGTISPAQRLGRSGYLGSGRPPPGHLCRGTRVWLARAQLLVGQAELHLAGTGTGELPAQGRQHSQLPGSLSK